MSTRRQLMEDARYLSELARAIEEAHLGTDGKWERDALGGLLCREAYSRVAKLMSISARLTLHALDLPDDEEAPR